MSTRSAPRVFDPKRLQQARRRRGLSQRGLANRSGLSLSVVSKYEAGVRTRPMLDCALALADALDVDVLDLTSAAS